MKTNQMQYIAYSCEKSNIIYSFLLKNNFATGVTESNHYHFHASYELHIPIRGGLRILADDSELLLHPGEVCIIPPYAVHYVYDSENSYKTGFRFRFSLVDQKQTELAQLFDRAFGSLSKACVIKDCFIYDKYLSTATERYMQEGTEIILSELLFLALYEVAYLLDEKTPVSTKTANLWEIIMTEQIEEYLNTHYAEKLYLQDLAQFLNLSSRQTERNIKKLFGCSFSALVNKKRLAIAKFLLRTTNLSMDEIAIQAGFRDKSYFYRRFFASYAITPTEYRKSGDFV